MNLSSTKEKSIPKRKMNSISTREKTIPKNKMNLSSTEKKTNLNEKLTNTEILYLRLYAHGYNSKTIKDILEITNRELRFFERRLNEIFQLHSYENIVLNAFKKNILRQTDYIENNISELALLQSQELFYTCLSDTSLSISSKDIESRLLEYVQECHMSSINHYDRRSKKSKLTSTEQDLIQLNYLYFKSEENFIFQSDIYGNSRAIILEESIFSKLKVNNWFCVFVKSLQFNIIHKEDNYSSVIKKMIRETRKEVIAIKKITLPTNKEKLSLVYNRLLDMHSKIKFSFLFNDTHLNSKDQ